VVEHGLWNLSYAGYEGGIVRHVVRLETAACNAASSFAVFSGLSSIGDASSTFTNQMDIDLTDTSVGSGSVIATHTARKSVLRSSQIRCLAEAKVIKLRDNYQINCAPKSMKLLIANYRL